MRRTNLARASALLLATAVTACDVLTGNKEGSFALSVGEAAVTLGQSGRDTIPVTVTRSDFNKPITLTVAGVPTGVSAFLVPPILPSGATASELRLTVPATATPGTSTLTIRATAEGLDERTATMSLTINVTGSFSLSTLGFPASAAQGGGAIGTLLITRSGGHADNVALTADAPAGITAELSATSTSASAVALTVSVGSSVASGAHTLTITGNAPGLTAQTTQVTVNVMAPPSTTTLSVPYCASSVPAWFAYQNDGYLWRSITPTGAVFTFPATARLAIAYVRSISNASANETHLNILYASRAEFAAQSDRDCAGPKSLSGSVVGATSGQTTRVQIGATTGNATFAVPGYSLSGVADRVLDLVATKGTITTTTTSLQVTPDLLIVRRALNPASGSTLSDLTFPGESFAPASSSLTIANSGAGDQLNVGVTLWTGTSTYGVVHAFQPTATVNTLYSAPAARLQAADQHELLVETWQPGFVSGRVHVAYAGALGDRTETLGPTLATPSVSTAATTAYVRLRGQLPVQTEYPTATRFIYFQDGGSASDRLVYVVATVGYLGATPSSTWDVVIPEFGPVTGLDVSWFPSTPSVIYQAEAYGGAGALLFGALPSAGDLIRVAYRVQTNNTLLRGVARPVRPVRLARIGAQYFRR